MRKLLFVLVLTSFASLAWATDGSSIVRSDLDTIISWTGRYDSGVVILDVLAGLRGGANVDLQFKLGSQWAMGFETGAHTFSFEINDVPQVLLMDIPILAKLSLDIGETEFQLAGGLLYALDMASTTRFQTRLTVQGRIYLANLEFVGGYVWNTAASTAIPAGERASYLRLGMGYRIPLVQ